VTERLSDLMHRAVDELVIPPAPSSEVLNHGRRVRRRRGLANVAVAAAAVILVSGVGVAVFRDDGDGRDSSDDSAQAAETAGGLTGPVFSIGTTVYLDGASRTATIDDKAVKSMYYTSAGVLVRHGENPYSDGGGPMRFSLVSADGGVRPVEVTFEERVPSVDPDEPYLAYAEVVDDVVQVVVLDVRDGSELARVPVPDAHKWGGWTAPPVSLDGDLVYVGTEDVQRVVDWRAGTVATTTAINPGYPDVRNGHAVTYEGRKQLVVDVADGSTLVTSRRNEFLMMSPDGRYALGQTYGPDDQQARLVDLATGSDVPLTIQGNGLGWSPDDSVFALTGSKLTTCPAATGDCTTVTLDLEGPPGDDESFDDALPGATVGGILAGCVCCARSRRTTATSGRWCRSPGLARRQGTRCASPPPRRTPPRSSGPASRTSRLPTPHPSASAGRGPVEDGIAEFFTRT
jgi:hypothetical protein